MCLTENCTFIVELEGDRPLASSGICLVDLSSEDDRGDIEPSYDEEHGLECTLGKRDRKNDDVRKIVRVWEYVENKPFNCKFHTFIPVSLVDFVRRVCDAAVLDFYTEEEIASLKKDYHV